MRDFGMRIPIVDEFDTPLTHLDLLIKLLSRHYITKIVLTNIGIFK